MQRIDAHQHFWHYDPVRDSWITEDMATLRKDYLPSDLIPLLKAHGLDGCVAVQADQSEAETTFLLELAARHSEIRGVVGWIDLQDPGVAQRLEAFSTAAQLKGFRHILQGEPQRDLMLQPRFQAGIALLAPYGYTYDILIYPDQLLFARELAANFPYQKFVLDHAAKPPISSGALDTWKRDIESLASCENVYCKISGLVTEADWKGWKREDFRPYLDALAAAFGPSRLLFGSDWPVCLLAAGYGEVLSLATDYFSAFSAREQEGIFGGNAIQFYNL